MSLEIGLRHDLRTWPKKSFQSYCNPVFSRGAISGHKMQHRGRFDLSTNHGMLEAHKWAAAGCVDMQTLLLHWGFLGL